MQHSITRTAHALLATVAVLLTGCAQHARADRPAKIASDPYALSIVPYPQILLRRRGAYVWPGRAAPDHSLSANVDVQIVNAARSPGEGAYRLDVTPGGVRIRAANALGVFYARQTLQQATMRLGGRHITPALHVEDVPRYAWRGIHIDLARRYFDLHALERFIGLAARYKLNVVHMHFTDNQAWRLPSRAYPALTSPQHYTRAQIRQLTAYAARDFITIVPEIDLPAHSAAAIRAYPKLSCGRSDELCPLRADGFADAVVREVAQMFPGNAIHLGGDEVQSWTIAQRAAFERHVAGTLRSLHRSLILWDDESDVAPPDATIMVWHLDDAAQRAFERTHRIVMAADGPLYFNAAQGDPAQEPLASRYVSTLEQVYSYDPNVSALGIEATVWTEHVHTPQGLWYALLPRELALAEAAWIQPRRKDWNRFYSALPEQLAWLCAHGYRTRIPNVMYRVQNRDARYESVPGKLNDASVEMPGYVATVELDEAMPGATVWYRASAREGWRLYRRPLTVRAGSVVGAYALLGERRSAISQLRTLHGGRNALRGSKSFDALVSP